MMQFDTDFDTLYSFKKIGKVKELDNETFQPRGMTALLDAIGKTIADTKAAIKKMDKDGIHNRRNRLAR